MSREQEERKILVGELEGRFIHKVNFAATYCTRSLKTVAKAIIIFSKQQRFVSVMKSFNWILNFPPLFQLTFRLSDVQVPDLPGMFTTFKAKSQPLFVDGTQFHDLEHFGKIMGYDKPLDLRMRDGVTSGHRDAQDRWERVMGRDKKQD